MVLIKLLIEIICFHQILSLDFSPNSPVPHAELLDDILEAEYFKNYTEPNSLSIFDYLFEGNFTNLENMHISDHLDISVLSPDNLKKIVEKAQKEQLLRIGSYNESVEGQDLRRNYIYYGGRAWNSRFMNWMKQSIYGTRRRLEATRPYRKKFQKDISYNIGILYGILKDMMLKANSVFTSLNRMHFHMYFMWFLYAYQRILTFHTDATYIIQRMFEFQKKWNVVIGRKEKGEYDEGVGSNEAGNLTAMFPDMGGDFFNNMPMDTIPGGMDSPNMPGMPGSPPGPGDHRGQGAQGIPGPGAEMGPRGESGPHGGPGPGAGMGPRGESGPHGGPGPGAGMGPRGEPGPHGGPGPGQGIGPRGDPGSHREPWAQGGPGPHGDPGQRGI